MEPKQPNESIRLASGDYAIINSSRICNDALLPALYLGTDPKDSTKHIFLVDPKTTQRVEIENRFIISASKTLRILPVKWESTHRDVNSVVYSLSQHIEKLTTSAIINIDSIIAEVC